MQIIVLRKRKFRECISIEETTDNEETFALNSKKDKSIIRYSIIK